MAGEHVEVEEVNITERDQLETRLAVLRSAFVVALDLDRPGIRAEIDALKGQLAGMPESQLVATESETDLTAITAKLGRVRSLLAGSHGSKRRRLELTILQLEVKLTQLQRNTTGASAGQEAACMQPTSQS